MTCARYRSNTRARSTRCAKSSCRTSMLQSGRIRYLMCNLRDINMWIVNVWAVSYSHVQSSSASSHQSYSHLFISHVLIFMCHLLLLIPLYSFLVPHSIPMFLIQCWGSFHIMCSKCTTHSNVINDAELWSSSNSRLIYAITYQNMPMISQDVDLDHCKIMITLSSGHTPSLHHSKITYFQMEYTQRVQKELRRKHALQNKQQPKNLRRKKQQIHKQFEATCKIIESQVSCGMLWNVVISWYTCQNDRLYTG